MKVVSNSPDRLVIENRPWFLWAVFFGLGGTALFSAVTGQVGDWGTTFLVATMGTGAIWAGWRFEPFQRFVFDRQAGTFVHEVHRLTGSRTWQRPLADIRRAADEGHWSDGARLERITLLTNDGRHPLESGYGSTRRKPVIDAINEWLGDSGV